MDGDVNVDDNVKWRRALCGCSALSPKRRHQRKINQQRDVAKCFFRELSDTFLQILQEMLVLLDLRFYINSNSLQENDLSSSSVKTLGEAPDLVFGGRWRQTRKHLMFANKKTSEHSMFRNEKSSGNLKQIGNRIVARVPASLWRVAGNFFYQIITHHIMCHQCSNSIKHITLSSTMMKTIRWSGPVLTSSSPSCNSAITQRCSVEGIYSITIIVIIVIHHQQHKCFHTNASAGSTLCY